MPIDMFNSAGENLSLSSSSNLCTFANKINNELDSQYGAKIAGVNRTIINGKIPFFFSRRIIDLRFIRYENSIVFFFFTAVFPSQSTVGLYKRFSRHHGPPLFCRVFFLSFFSFFYSRKTVIFNVRVALENP